MVLGENPPHEVFVDIDEKGPGDLLRDSGTSKPGIAALHLQNELDEFWGRSLGTGLASSFGGVEQAIFPFSERPVKSQNR